MLKQRCSIDVLADYVQLTPMLQTCVDKPSNSICTEDVLTGLGIVIVGGIIIYTGGTAYLLIGGTAGLAY